MDPSVSVPVWLRNPRYTGPNRCLLCTVVNLGIAAALALAVATASVGWAVVVFTVGVATIAVRGYLVPGTPELTKRYLPERVLAWVGKGPTPRSEALDAAATLVGAGVLRESATAADLVLEAGFHDAWRRHARRLADANADAAALARFVDADPEAVSVADRGHAYVGVIGDEPVGRWESRPAFLADLAAAAAIDERWSGWAALSTARRSELLGSLRLFVETCPTCDGHVTLDATVVGSTTCSSRRVTPAARGSSRRTLTRGRSRTPRSRREPAAFSRRIAGHRSMSTRLSMKYPTMSVRTRTENAVAMNNVSWPLTPASGRKLITRRATAMIAVLTTIWSTGSSRA
ncbi:MAG: hypothetical protein A07HR67_00108 [uncultured archaeon A07HR67]|nr:MAG: hypothetical protein A07HR67_00108 [uncultured archaeon A07HR67]